MGIPWKIGGFFAAQSLALARESLGAPDEREAAALERLGVLNAAMVVVGQKNAGAVGAFGQRQASAIGKQAREPGREIVNVEIHLRGDARGFVVGEDHVAGALAARAATLADKAGGGDVVSDIKWHTGRLAAASQCCQVRFSDPYGRDASDAGRQKTRLPDFDASDFPDTQTKGTTGF
jgi:hypothetical protein